MQLSKSGVRIRIITHRLFIKYFHQIAVSQTICGSIGMISVLGSLLHAGKDGRRGDLYIEDSPSTSSVASRGAKTIVFTNSTTNIYRRRAGTWDEVAEMVLAEKLEWERDF